MRSFRFLPVLLAASGLLVMGFGCKKPTPLIEQLKQQAAAERAAAAAHRTPLPDPAIEARRIHEQSHRSKIPAPEIQGAIQALKNLHAAQSYRAHSDVSTPDGALSVDIEFDRTHQAVHATVNGGPGRASEIISLPPHVYVRANGSAWADAAAQNDRSGYQDLLHSLLSLEGNATGTFIHPGAALIESKDDPSGCRLVRFTNYEWSKEEVDMCISNALPVSVAIHGMNGDQTTVYRDVNAPIAIQPPLK